MSTPALQTGPGSRLLLTAASTIIVIAGLRAAQGLLIPFLIAAFLAVLCAPPVLWLQRHRVPTVVAVVLVVLVLTLLLSLVGAVVGQSVNNFVDAIPRYEKRITDLADSIRVWLDRLPFDVPKMQAVDIIDPGKLLSYLGSGLKTLLAAVSNVMLVTLTLVFMLLEAAGLASKVRAAFGPAAGDDGRFAIVTQDIQRYLAIKTILSIATGTAVGVWMAILGVDFALVWGLLAFLLNYIPNLGSIVAAIPAVLLALLQLGFGSALAALLGFVVVNMILGNLVEPHLLGRRLGLSTLVVFLSLVFWGWIWGPVGMFLSVPLTMIAKILFEHSDDLEWIAVLLDSPRAAEERLAKRGPVRGPV